MWLVPAYRRVAPDDCGQQAISSASKPDVLAHNATSAMGASGKGAVNMPSFMEPPAFPVLCLLRGAIQQRMT
jgi:hypothetical protein